jgi:hypothetical protein
LPTITRVLPGFGESRSAPSTRCPFTDLSHYYKAAQLASLAAGLDRAASEPHVTPGRHVEVEVIGAIAAARADW